MHYGYRMMASEAPYVAVKLWNFVEDYANTHLRYAKQRWALWHPGMRARV